MKNTVIIFLLAVLHSGVAMSEPGIEEISEAEARVAEGMAKLDRSAEAALAMSSRDKTLAMAEMLRIDGETKSLEAVRKRLDGYRTDISNGFGCVSGRCVNGVGRYAWKDGNFYEGAFVSHKRHGSGTFVYSGGKRLSGEWIDNRLEGSCRFSSPNVSEISGTCSYSSEGKLEFRRDPIREEPASKTSSPPPAQSSQSSQYSPSASSSRSTPPDGDGWGLGTIATIAAIVFLIFMMAKHTFLFEAAFDAVAEFLRNRTNIPSRPSSGGGGIGSAIGGSIPPSFGNRGSSPPQSQPRPTVRNSGGNGFNPGHVSPTGVRADGRIRD